MTSGTLVISETTIIASFTLRTTTRRRKSWFNAQKVLFFSCVKLHVTLLMLKCTKFDSRRLFVRPSDCLSFYMEFDTFLLVGNRAEDESRGKCWPYKEYIVYDFSRVSFDRHVVCFHLISTNVASALQLSSPTSSV